MKKNILEKVNFDDIIQRLHEFGIINFWHSQMIKNKNTDMGLDDEEITPLGISHISSSFLILFGGCLMALLIFLMECHVSKQCKSDKLTDEDKKKWLLLSKCIDSERYFYVTDFIK